MGTEMKTAKALDLYRTESDLLLWLTNRSPVPSVEILGHRDVAASWTQLRR